MKKLIISIVLIVFIFVFVSCGETVKGAKRDTKRVGKGIKTIFKSD